MANFLPKRNSLPRKLKHWSNRVRESVVSRGSNGVFNVQLEGGAEYGEFIYIGDIFQEKIKLKKGKLHLDDIVLEIDNEPVAGYTQSDMIDFVKKAGETIILRTVKQDSGITKDIRQFLTTQFEKGSVDNDLQQTIRENLYKRTVPCTTRYPREGEIPGVDYTFLTLEEFREMEQSGQLLESGIFEGNHYGTPKPPREPQKEAPKSFNKPHHNSYPSLDRKRPRSQSDTRNHKNIGLEKSSKENQRRKEQDLGPLPPNWEIGYTESNEKYFIDHNTGSTQWLDPRLVHVQKTGADECDGDELPYGWERVVDPKYGTYYIDHNNKRTQFENPVRQRRKSHDNSSRYNGAHDRTHKYSPPSIRSAAAMAKAQQAEASARWPGVGFDEVPEPPAYTAERFEPMPRRFVVDGRELEGELIRTMLPKGSRGFGFTIVGGDQPGELLQIKSIVTDSAAAKDGVLRMGDALIRVNGRSVLSKSHQDVVGMFQAMPIGETVELEMIRGYPLPFDPNDPNVETIGSYTVVRAPAGSTRSASPSHSDQSGSSFSKPRGTNKSVSQGGQLSGHSHLYPMRHHAAPTESPVGQQPSQYSSTLPRTSTAIALPKGTPEFITVRVVKGPMGFGFTIADSPYGQKVKQILDANRCLELREGDILVEINGQLVRSCTHNEAVNILKNCPKDREAVMVIQRGGLPTPLKNSPMSIRKDESQDEVVRRNPRPKSTPVMRYDGQNSLLDPQPVLKSGSVGNMATTGESTRNQETGSEYRQTQPQVEHRGEPYNRYPSLKKAVANTSYNRSSEMMNGARSSTGSEDGVTDLSINLKRGEMGFGFRIVGGQEQKTQVSVGTIVPGGAADQDGRIRKGDEIITIDGINIQGASHRRVISLMSNASHTGQVLLGLRRRAKSGSNTPPVTGMRRATSTSSELMNITDQSSQINHVSRLSSRSAGNLIDYGKNDTFGRDKDETESVRSFHSHTGELNPQSKALQRDRRRSESDAAEPPGTSYRDVTLYREEREGFGFVILSSVHKSGSTIGRIIQGSPADRCQQLHVGDRLVAVNGQSIVGMHHSDIVETIKQSGQTVTLRIALIPSSLDSEENKKLTRMSAPNIAKQTDSQTRLDSGWSDSRSASADQLQDIDRQKERQKEELLRRHKEELRRQQQELIEKQREEMRRLEDEQNRYRQEYNPPQPPNPSTKPAPPPIKPKPSKDKSRENLQTEQWNGDSQAPSTRPSEPTDQYSKPLQQNRPPPPPRHSIPVGSRDNLGRVRRLSYEGLESRTVERPARDQILSKTNQMLLIELRRQANGYGFSIRGGQEMNMPVVVLRIAEGGAADLDGRLKIGDEIIEINGSRTEGIKHTEAIELIKNGGPRVVLLIKRANAETNFDKGIPNGGQMISQSGWSKPTTGMYRPPPQQQPVRDSHVYSR